MLQHSAFCQNERSVSHIVPPLYLKIGLEVSAAQHCGRCGPLPQL